MSLSNLFFFVSFLIIAISCKVKNVNSIKGMKDLPGYSGDSENAYSEENGGFKWAQERAMEFGSICRTTYLGQDAILLTGESGIELFYNDKLIIRDGLSGAADKKYLGDGSTPIVPLLDGDLHLKRKTDLLKMFDDDDLNRYTPIIENFLREEIDGWTTQDTVDVKAQFGSIGFRLLSLLSFGEPGDIKYEVDYYTTLAAAFRMIDGDFVDNRDRLLKWYAEELSNTRAKNGESVHTMLGVLVNETNMTDQEILAETQHLFIGAGGVGGVGCNIVARLQEDKTIFDIIKKEAEQLNFPLSLDSWSEDHYYQRYIEELQRVSPFINTQIGRAKEDFVFNDYLIPKDILIVAGFHATNMDNHLFSNAQKLDPDRAIEFEKLKNEKSCPFSKFRKNAYVPFGGGSRTSGHRCLGEPLLYLIMKTFVTILVKDYNWTVLNTSEIMRYPSPHLANRVLVKFSRN